MKLKLVSSEDVSAVKSLDRELQYLMELNTVSSQLFVKLYFHGIVDGSSILIEENPCSVSPHPFQGYQCIVMEKGLVLWKLIYAVVGIWDSLLKHPSCLMY